MDEDLLPMVRGLRKADGPSGPVATGACFDVPVRPHTGTHRWPRSEWLHALAGQSCAIAHVSLRRIAIGSTLSASVSDCVGSQSVDGVET